MRTVPAVATRPVRAITWGVLLLAGVVIVQAGLLLLAYSWVRTGPAPVLVPTQPDPMFGSEEK
jgi:hypothetical protein